MFTRHNSRKTGTRDLLKSQKKQKRKKKALLLIRFYREGGVHSGSLAAYKQIRGCHGAVV